ncbi:MAG: chorismate synthase [Ruminococcaceae bacterium]|nr:chorismate synthase [Oscillospiraceae bacterium]
MSSEFGRNIRISVFGQSHGEAIGVLVDGLPAGERIDLDALQAFMERRAPGRAKTATSRKEPDEVRIVSGLVDGKTCAAPLCGIIFNTNTRSQDYAELLDKPRPAHADFTAWKKWGGAADMRGGGHFSGRLTAPLCIAGGICLQILENRGITVGAHIERIAGVCDSRFDPVGLTAEMLKNPGSKPFAVIDDAAGEAMQRAILDAAAQKDSVGGIIEIGAVGLPAGLGAPMFDGVENRLAQALFGIPAVKGVEFGEGFDVAGLRGSENNDPFRMENGQIVTDTNHAGGILGGITSGMPLIARIAIKPTPSIAQEQNTVSLSRGENAILAVHGRHDPCIVPRAVPVAEAVCAAVILDLILD